VSEDQIGAFGRELGDTRYFKKRRAGNKVPKCERPRSVQHALGSGKQGVPFFAAATIGKLFEPQNSDGAASAQKSRSNNSQ
jgi:hypothetical protein